MKRLIKRILLFLVPFLLIGLVLDIAVSKRMSIIYFPSGENEVWNDIYNHNIIDPCLIYGSSRAKTHVNPMIIEDSTGIRAYNFGMDGQSFDTQMLRHRINVKENGYPRYIIHSLDLFTLSKTKKAHNRQQYLPYMLWNVEIMKTLIGYEDFHLIDYLIPTLRYFGHYDSFKRSITEPFEPQIYRERTKGFAYINFGWDPEKKVSDNRHRIDVNADTYRLYEDFVKECKENHVALAMIYSPEYIDKQKTVINRDSIMNLYEGLSEEYDIPFLDYTTDSMSYNRDLYGDPEHFNKDGCIIFTKKVIKDLSQAGFFDNQN